MFPGAAVIVSALAYKWKRECTYTVNIEFCKYSGGSSVAQCSRPLRANGASTQRRNQRFRRGRKDAAGCGSHVPERRRAVDNSSDSDARVDTDALALDASNMSLGFGSGAVGCEYSDGSGRLHGGGRDGSRLRPEDRRAAPMRFARGGDEADRYFSMSR